LNGNPGLVDDFVRTEDSWTLPAFASAIFEAGWSESYPLIEYVGGEA
jgi:hypothetical protein